MSEANGRVPPGRPPARTTVLSAAMTGLANPGVDERLVRGWQSAVGVVYPLICAAITLVACLRIGAEGKGAPGWALLCALLWLSLGVNCVALALLRAGGPALRSTALTASALLAATVFSAVLPPGLLPWAVVPLFVAVFSAFAAVRIPDERLRLAAATALNCAAAALTTPLFALYALGLLRNESLLGTDIKVALIVGAAAAGVVLASRRLWTGEWAKSAFLVVVLTIVIRAALDLMRGESPAVVAQAMLLTLGTAGAALWLMSVRSKAP